MESWIGMKNLDFCSGYNAPTVLQNLQQRSLAYRERGTLQTCYPLYMVHSQAFHLITRQPSSKGFLSYIFVSASPEQVKMCLNKYIFFYKFGFRQIGEKITAKTLHRTLQIQG